MMHRIVSGAAILGLGAVLLAPSAGAQTPVTPAALKPVTIYILQRVMFRPPTWGFNPPSITISVGTTLTWKSSPGNSEGHTSTSNDGWTSPLLNPGDAWSLTFSQAGRYPYHCALHPWMVGVVDVVAGASMPPPNRLYQNLTAGIVPWGEDASAAEVIR